MSYNTLVIDGASMFGAGEIIAEREGVDRVNFDYDELKKILTDLCRSRSWRQGKKSGFDQNVIMVSTDPNSEAQSRFLSALERIGFDVDRMNFREIFVSLPPGRVPPTGAERVAGDRTRGLVSMAPRITYLAGLLSRYKDSQLLVVSHAYELFTPLHDFASRVSAGGGHVGLAYFGTLLDHRYRQTGMIEKGNADGVEFFDLDPHISKLTGGTITTKSERAPSMATTAFSKFK
jgi:hypothetical protein